MKPQTFMRVATILTLLCTAVIFVSEDVCAQVGSCLRAFSQSNTRGSSKCLDLKALRNACNIVDG